MLVIEDMINVGPRFRATPCKQMLARKPTSELEELLQGVFPLVAYLKYHTLPFPRVYCGPAQDEPKGSARRSESMRRFRPRGVCGRGSHKKSLCIGDPRFSQYSDSVIEIRVMQWSLYVKP